MEIMSFMKDAYGMPYVPGSSLKGMIRTALLSYEITHHPEKFAGAKMQLQRKASVYEKRNRYLSRETNELETKAFHTLEKDMERVSNAVNCNLSGLIVSDSRPISTEQLTLSQKIDYTLTGQQKALPIMRETLIPGTEIFFNITIDRERCPYTVETIMKALDEFQQISYQYFYSRFKRGTKEPGTVWLGGGCGYLSKTIIYPLFEKDAVKVTDQIYQNTLGKQYGQHKHNKDISVKIAPHVCKCTRYHGKLYDMGMGRIELLET
jgi:CRISPR-associated protein Csm5